MRNGQIWTITRVRDDGSITVRPPGRRFGGSIVLPASYVVEHVDLGYTVTEHRAQGATVDTAHVLVEPATTRENFYVSRTRVRNANRAYVFLDQPDEHHNPHLGDSPDATARSVLYGFQHGGAELSAHETMPSSSTGGARSHNSRPSMRRSRTQPNTSGGPASPAGAVTPLSRLIP